jgi:hypothetical protein
MSPSTELAKIFHLIEETKEANFEFLAAAFMGMQVFWIMMLCRLVKAF